MTQTVAIIGSGLIGRAWGMIFARAEPGTKEAPGRVEPEAMQG